MSERKPTQKQTIKLSLLTPMDLEDLKNHAGLIGDCYGRDYDPLTECAVCHDSESCMTLFQDYIKKQKKELEKRKAFLDGVDFEKLNKNKAKIATAIRKSDGIEINSLLNQIANKSGMKDKKSNYIWLSRLIKEYNLHIQTREGKEFVC